MVPLLGMVIVMSMVIVRVMSTVIVMSMVRVIIIVIVMMMMMENSQTSSNLEHVADVQIPGEVRSAIPELIQMIYLTQTFLSIK